MKGKEKKEKLAKRRNSKQIEICRINCVTLHTQITLLRNQVTEKNGILHRVSLNDDGHDNGKLSTS